MEQNIKLDNLTYDEVFKELDAIQTQTGFAPMMAAVETCCDTGLLV